MTASDAGATGEDGVDRAEGAGGGRGRSLEGPETDGTLPALKTGGHDDHAHRVADDAVAEILAKTLRYARERDYTG